MKTSILIALIALSSCASNPNRPCDRTEQSGFMIETLKIQEQDLREKAKTEFETNNKCRLETEP